jgi:hypothetical protein
MKDLKKGKVYSFQLENCDDLVSGVVVAQGDEFIMLRKLSLDYLLDGVMFIRTMHVEKVYRKKSEKFKDAILSEKYSKMEELRIPNLNKVGKFFKWLAIFDCIDITLVDYYGAVFLGEITELTKKKIVLNSLTPTAEWNGETTYKIDNISIINVETDYIHSLMMMTK